MAGDAAKTTGALRTKEEAADRQLRNLREEAESARTELAALHASAAYRSLEELSERRTTVEARAVIECKIEMDAVAYKPRRS